MNKTPDSLDHVQFDPKYNLQMMFELLVEIIALQQATNKVLTERLYGEEAILVEDEIIKACADLKPRIMESLYVQFDNYFLTIFFLTLSRTSFNEIKRNVIKRSSNTQLHANCKMGWQ